MKRLFNILTLAVLVAVTMFAADAFADDPGNFFENAKDKATNIFQQTKTLIFIVGAFRLMVLAVGAIFGKMAWKTFAYLALGLLILIGAGALITYLVNDQSWQGNIVDTLT